MEVSLDRWTNSAWWYLASPYSKYKDGHDSAFLIVRHMASVLWFRRHVQVFSPIVYTHQFAAYAKYVGKDSADEWYKLDKPFLDQSIGVMIAGIPGWEDSSGVRWEAVQAFESGKPVVLCRMTEVRARTSTVFRITFTELVAPRTFDRRIDASTIFEDVVKIPMKADELKQLERQGAGALHNLREYNY